MSPSGTQVAVVARRHHKPVSLHHGGTEEDFLKSERLQSGTLVFNDSDSLFVPNGFVLLFYILIRLSGNGLNSPS